MDKELKEVVKEIVYQNTLILELICKPVYLLEEAKPTEKDIERLKRKM